MDRQTRKANFKKLQQQQPATTKLRSTRSNKAATLSEYFNTQVENPSREFNLDLQQQTDNDELFAEPKTKKTREDTDCAAPSKPKKAPKLKTTTAPRRGRTGSRGRSKQQPSISDFLRNEQLFAEVTAQHCIADNFSPNDIEMALALSKSEAEKFGVLRLHETTAEEQEEVVNLVGKNGVETTENIRRKLQKYGFRTAAKQDYNMLSWAALPGGGKRGKRCKWANKFTALTLRQPAEQLKKVDNKVAALMAQQVRTQLPAELRCSPLKLSCSNLQQLIAPTENSFIHEPSASALAQPSLYYVEQLFEVSKLPAHHLLKNWAAIPGRDLSPKRPSAQSQRLQQQLEQVYAELEAYFGTTAEREELDRLEQLVAVNMIQDETLVSVKAAPNSPLKEPLEKRARTQLEEENVMSTPLEDQKTVLQTQLEEQRNVLTTQLVEKTIQPMQLAEKDIRLQTRLKEQENILPSASASLSVPTQSTGCTSPELLEEESYLPMQQAEKDLLLPTHLKEKVQVLPITSSYLSAPTQSTRCTSPDLFADSDDEQENEVPVELANFSLKVYKDITSTEINSYEVYSSDEVKIVIETAAERLSAEAQTKESFIDLTQDPDSEEFALSKSLTAQDIFCLSPNIAFEHEVGALDNTLAEQTNETMEDCSISDELYAKYAHRTVRIKDSNLSSTGLSPLKNDSSNSFSQDTTLSFSHLENTRNAFPRSFSLTQTEHRFKSPLSHKSKSFADKTASALNQSVSPLNHSASPFNHSATSIDLTQDSNDEDDEDDYNEGPLLSDDEINYSIWKADKTFRETAQPKDDSIYCTPLTKKLSVPYFENVDDLDAYLAEASPAASLKSCNSRSPNKSALSKERAEFGILDAAHSQPFALSQVETTQIHIDWTDASFLDVPVEAPLKRYSHSSHKFQELLQNISKSYSSEDELDEFDRLVLRNAEDSTTSTCVDTVPSGLDRLMLGEINMEPVPPASQPAPSAVQPDTDSVQFLKTVTDPALFVQPFIDPAAEQLELNGQLYNVRICHELKPDFVNLTEAELLQQLYNYGIKPLKRKQAVKLLEFIYNQTHPIMLPPEKPQNVFLPPEQPLKMPLPRSKSTPVPNTSKSRVPLQHAASEDCLTPKETDAQPSYQFQDACGAQLLRFSQAVPPDLCDDFECYVLQTNVTKKTPQPLLPLHIAWHNLLCANPSLHESLLMFIPIDLQEIYMYFKQQGQRYDPKDLKCFFDKRCIIFRYELAPPTKQIQRHVRKKPKKPSSKF